MALGFICSIMPGLISYKASKWDQKSAAARDSLPKVSTHLKQLNLRCWRPSHELVDSGYEIANFHIALHIDACYTKKRLPGNIEEFEEDHHRRVVLRDLKAAKERYVSLGFSAASLADPLTGMDGLRISRKKRRSFCLEAIRSRTVSRAGDERSN